MFEKGYGFLSFAKNVGKHLGRNVCRNLSCKNSQKLLDYAKQTATDRLRLLQKEPFKKQLKQLVI